MLEEAKRTINKFSTFIRNNKYNSYFIVAIAILLLMIIAMIAITFNHTSKKSSPTPAPEQNPAQTTNSISSLPPSGITSVTTPDPTQAAAIESQIQPQITETVTIPYTVSAITEYGKNWGVASLNNPNANIGGVIIKNVNGTWKVVAGPGSYFPAQQLQSLGAPQEMINNFQNPPSPPVSPTPTPVPGDLQ